MKFASPHVIAYFCSDMDSWIPTQEMDLGRKEEERRTLGAVEIANAIGMRRMVVMIYGICFHS
jgi:hypothetical protein